ncbi:Kinesin-like protein kif13b [Saguinus oedipus]|uniref:Kinesin-like protein kif13b n=1 Tax=Saguinus oedipus TaxID=9490 RepID=A0ABQ9UA95_SAGOE|nr:Kinesin-like protein kif13b [Saguinus oedipus]
MAQETFLPLLIPPFPPHPPSRPPFPPSATSCPSIPPSFDASFPHSPLIFHLVPPPPPIPLSSATSSPCLLALDAQPGHRPVALVGACAGQAVLSVFPSSNEIIAQLETGPDVLVQTTGPPALKIGDKPAKAPSPLPVPVVTAATPAPEAQDGPPSPLSEASSGYFSHSVSTATLSEALGPGLDAASPPGHALAAPEAEPETPIRRPPPPTAGPAEEPTGPQQLAGPGQERLDLEAPAPGSPFRVRRVRASELRSFSRMLGGDPGCSPGAEGDAQAAGTGGQAPASDSEEADGVPEWLREGEFVTVGAHKTGVVRYVGPVDFQEGTWIGVELDLPSGDKVQAGKRPEEQLGLRGKAGARAEARKQYFRCNPGYGLLAPCGGAARRSATLSGSATNLASLTAALAKADRSHKNPENRKSWAS